PPPGSCATEDHRGWTAATFPRPDTFLLLLLGRLLLLCHPEVPPFPLQSYGSPARRLPPLLGLLRGLLPLRALLCGLLLRHGECSPPSGPSSGRLEAHCFGAGVGNLLPAAPLVVVEGGVELRQAPRGPR